MADDEDGSKSTAARMIYETQINMARARRQYRQSVLTNQVSETVVDELRSAVLSYYDVLRPYRDEKNIDEDWDTEGIDKLRDLAGQTQTVEVSGEGLGRRSETKEIPAIKTVGAETLIDISYKLDDLAKDLGFHADIDEKSTQTRITKDLVKRAKERAKELKAGNTGDV